MFKSLIISLLFVAQLFTQFGSQQAMPDPNDPFGGGGIGGPGGGAGLSIEGPISSTSSTFSIVVSGGYTVQYPFGNTVPIALSSYLLNVKRNGSIIHTETVYTSGPASTFGYHNNITIPSLNNGNLTLEVQALGQTASTQTTLAVPLPKPTISGPSTINDPAGASYTVTGANASKYKYNIDNTGSWYTVNSLNTSFHVSGLGNGNHTLYAKLIDDSNVDGHADDFVINVNIVSPNLPTITGASIYTSTNDPSFAISSTNATKYRYKLDGETNFTTKLIHEPLKLIDVPSGPHTIHVEAGNDYNVWSAPNSFPFTINFTGVKDNLSYTYNAAKQLVKVVDATSSTDFPDDYDTTDGSTDQYAYDSNGNPTKDLNRGLTSISYNEFNLATEIVKGSDTYSYKYNAMGQRIQKLKNGNVVSTYVRDEMGSILAELDASNNIKYTNRFGGDGTVLGKVDKTTATDIPHYYIKDHLGNTRVTYTTDGTVNAVHRADYYPYGSILRETSSLSEDEAKFKYQGKERDGETGYDYFEARLYDSAIGRFMQVDAFAEVFESMNPYTGMGNNPMRFVDPDGNVFIDWQSVAEEFQDHFNIGDVVTVEADRLYQFGTSAGVHYLTAEQREYAENTNERVYDRIVNGPEYYQEGIKNGTIKIGDPDRFGLIGGPLSKFKHLKTLKNSSAIKNLMKKMGFRLNKAGKYQPTKDNKYAKYYSTRVNEASATKQGQFTIGFTEGVMSAQGNAPSEALDSNVSKTRALGRVIGSLLGTLGQ